MLSLHTQNEKVASIDAKVAQLVEHDLAPKGKHGIRPWQWK